MSNKKLFLFLKILGLALSIFVSAWLLPMCDTVSDKWFSAWLQGTIASIFAIIFFVCWIAVTIIDWKEQ